MENNNRLRPVRTTPTSRKRRKMSEWKRFLVGNRLLIVSALVLAVVVTGIVLIGRSCSKMPNTSWFNGTYYIDVYTAYEFDGKGKGTMCLGETTRYVFEYTVKDNIISLDFEDDWIKDTAYTFTLNAEAITFTDANGTKSYTMVKKQKGNSLTDAMCISYRVDSIE